MYIVPKHISTKLIMANFIIKATTIQKFFTKTRVWVIRILSKPDKIFGPIAIRFRQVTLYLYSFLAGLQSNSGLWIDSVCLSVCLCVCLSVNILVKAA